MQIMAVPFKLTTDGFETQWQTNHLAAFLLTKILLPILESTAASSSSKNRVRIINVAVDAALIPLTPKQLDLAHPNLEYVTGAMNGWSATPLTPPNQSWEEAFIPPTNFRPRKRYGHSKIASIIHARALHNRLHGKGISAYSLHPGIVATNLQTADPSLFGTFLRLMVRWYVPSFHPSLPSPDPYQVSRRGMNDGILLISEIRPGASCPACSPWPKGRRRRSFARLVGRPRRIVGDISRRLGKRIRGLIGGMKMRSLWKSCGWRARGWSRGLGFR